MRRLHRHGFWWGFRPFGFRFWGPWGGMAGGLGFPRREDYLRMLEEYKEELEEMRREIGEELERVTQEIEGLSK